MNDRRRTACFCVWGIVSVLLLVAGCVLIPVFHQLIHSEVKDQIPLKNGSTSFKNWIHPPAPIYFQVWMYDVLNYEEVQEGEKPAVIQKGPYTYREERHKKDIVFHDDGTVQYREKRSFYFDRAKSAGPEEDTFHTINLPMLTLIEMVKSKFAFLESVLDIALKMAAEKLFIELSVKDLMWGYNDTLLRVVNKLAKEFHFNISIPAEFGLFYGQNGTDDGLYRIYSGQKDVDKFGQIFLWNNEKSLSMWTSEVANSINGSDGTIYPPFIDTSETKYLFSSDICRSLGMKHHGSVTKRGISLERFVAPEVLFGNVTINPDNAGFCTPAGNCLPSGLLNASVCRQGAPIVMSMPNFLGCDQDIINSINGLHPDVNEHQSHLDIEPLTGVVMNAGKKLQLNTILEKIKGIPETKNIKNRIYFPVMWLNESALIDEKDASDFKTEVLDNIKLTDGIKFSLIALGAFIIVLAVAFYARMRYRNKKSDQKSLLENENGQVQEYLSASDIRQFNSNHVNV